MSEKPAKSRPRRYRRTAQKATPRIDHAGRLLELLLEDGAESLLIAYSVRDEDGVSHVRTCWTEAKMQLLTLMLKRLELDVARLMDDD